MPASDRFSSLCALDGKSEGCHPTSTKRERNLRIQTNKSHRFSLSHSLGFFLLHLLPLPVFFFLSRMMWKCSFWCNWKQGALPVATNRCVSVLYQCGTGRLLARDHDKWNPPTTTSKVLPRPSPMTRPDALDSWHQNGKTLTEKN